VRDKKFKLIWNIAYKLDYPFASDLWAASSWQAQLEKGQEANYGQRTVGQYIQRPRFEFFDIENDPDEAYNLADKPEYAELLKTYQGHMKQMQAQLKDPWAIKWKYE
jgi:N-sulfoglucosamine sulfohydrolase